MCQMFFVSPSWDGASRIEVAIVYIELINSIKIALNTVSANK